MIAWVLATMCALHAIGSAQENSVRYEVCPGAEWFHRTDITPPAWTADLDVACVIGDHVFYRQKELTDEH